MLATFLPTRTKGYKACRAQAAHHISRVRRGPATYAPMTTPSSDPRHLRLRQQLLFSNGGAAPRLPPPPASPVPDNGSPKKATSFLPRPLVSSRRRMDSLLPGCRGVSSRRVNGRYRLRKYFAQNASFVFCEGHVRRLRPGILCSFCCPVSVPVPWRRTLVSNSQVLLHIGHARVSHGAFQGSDCGSVDKRKYTSPELHAARSHLMPRRLHVKSPSEQVRRCRHDVPARTYHHTPASREIILILPPPTHRNNDGVPASGTDADVQRVLPIRLMMR